MSKVVNLCKRQTLSGKVDALICPNVNFFTKSYLIMICVYLEAYAKEVGMTFVAHYNKRMKEVAIPHNLLMWSINPSNIRNLQHKFKAYEITIDAEEVDKYVSANPYRIAELFKFIGVDCDANSALSALKGKIFSVVDKRNRIVHYNDSASDITFDDIEGYIVLFKQYLRLLDGEVERLIKKMRISEDGEG